MSARERALPFRAAIALLGAALIVSACGPATSPAPGTQGGAAQTPVRGGTLTIDIGANQLNSLDHTGYAGLDRSVANLVVETLVFHDADMKLVPRLATSWRVESDQLTWTFELRPNVKFHDGTPFNAQALRSEVDRWMKEENALAFRNVGRHLASFQAVDEDTVRLKTKVAFPIFPNILGGFGAEISSPAAVQQFGKDIGIKQVGTGPFKVGSMVAGGTVTLVRNDDYWADEAYLDRIVLMQIPDASARTAGLISRQTDLIWELPPSQLASVEKQASVTVVRQPNIEQQAYVMNVRRPPLDKPEVRQALNYALDMAAVDDVAWEGLIEPFQGPLNPLLYDEDKSIQGLPYNPDKARELLEKAGATGLKLGLLHSPDPTLTREAQVIKEQFRKVGVELNLTQLEPATLTSRRLARDFDIIMRGWANSQVTMSPAMANLLRTTSSANDGQFTDPKMDALINQLEAEFDETKRSGIVNEIAKEYFRTAPWFGQRSFINLYAWADYVHGFKPWPTSQFLGLVKTWRSQ